MKGEELIEVNEFISANRHKNIAELALQLSKRKELPANYILNQVNGLQKAEKKFPFLTSYTNFIFPSPTSVAQSSSEMAARYKEGLFRKLRRVADLSGGMGIDSYFLAKKAEQLDYVEQNAELYQISQKNFEYLNASNINCHLSSAEEFIEHSETSYDLIYLDPDRRSNNKRHFKIVDCSPNVPSLLPSLFERSKLVLVKYSPMLDLKASLEELEFVKEVHILSIQNECKEMLYLLEKGYVAEPLIKAVNIDQDDQTVFSFLISEENRSNAEFSEVLNYLYEPNSSILKSGAFNLVGRNFPVKKIAPNTHLYTSEENVPDFPGRCLRIIGIATKASELTLKANIISRNSGMSVEEIKKKYKIKEGGDQFLYAMRLKNGKRIFVLGEPV